MCSEPLFPTKWMNRWAPFWAKCIIESRRFQRAHIHIWDLEIEVEDMRSAFDFSTCFLSRRCSSEFTVYNYINT